MKMLSSRKSFVCFLLILFVLVGCAPFGSERPIPVEKMTPTQKATWFMTIYNSQFEIHKAEAAQPNLSEAKRKYLNDKKALLTEVWPLIKLYNSYVETGAITSVETEDQIIMLINRILMKTLE